MDHVPQYAADALFVEPALIAQVIPPALLCRRRSSCFTPLPTNSGHDGDRAQCERLTGELRPHLLRNVVVSARHGRYLTYMRCVWSEEDPCGLSLVVDYSYDDTLTHTCGCGATLQSAHGVLRGA